MKTSYSMIAGALASATEYTFENVTVTPYARLVGGISYVDNAFQAGETGSQTEVASNQWGTSYAGARMTQTV